MPKVILFDLDGVLVDSRAAIAASINHALAAQGLPTHAPDELYPMIGPPLALGFAELTGTDANSDTVAALVASYRDRYEHASLTETVAFDGVREMLETLAEHHALGVATSKPVVFAEPILEAVGLRDLFATVTGPGLELEVPSKAELIADALAVLRPDGAVMVGDRAFDIEGAIANGIPAIGVSWGIGSVDELALAGADAIVGSPDELVVAIALVQTRRS